MLGRPLFLISTAIVCILALWVFFYALFGVDDGIIRLKVATVTSVALLTSVISLALLLIGIMVRVITRPWKSETFFMR
ncbi:MAG: hypothetical protein OEU92_09810 [Alphaproteobacteria bacterium]|nr:hypothetical protein [Alphaproteobacteria bacterium]